MLRNLCTVLETNKLLRSRLVFCSEQPEQPEKSPTVQISNCTYALVRKFMARVRLGKFGTELPNSAFIVPIPQRSCELILKD
jgi:hypothetical protein